MALPDKELADRIEEVWKNIKGESWESLEEVAGESRVHIWMRNAKGEVIGGMDVTDLPQAAIRAELIVKTINTIPRILEILRR